MKLSSTVAVVTLVIGVIFSASAEPSKDLARLGKSSYMAFRCSALAGAMKNREEARRLFQMGFEHGKTFLEAMRSGTVSEEDIRSTVPMAVTMRIEGPSIDFMLGRIYAAAEEDALDDVFCGDKGCYDDELQHSIAGEKFHKENCELLGR